MKGGKARKRQRGFTLLELLVAVALTSIVIIGLMVVFRSMLTMYVQIRESRENAMQVRALVGLLGDDLLTVSRSFEFVGRTGESGGRVVRLLEFVSGVSVERQEAEPVLTQVMVIYSLARIGNEEQWTLMRGERPYPHIAGDWKESLLPALRHVERLKFYYEWPSRTQDLCVVHPGGALPHFVRLELALRHGGKTAAYSLRFPVRYRF